jgi:hypothetical protein
VVLIFSGSIIVVRRLSNNLTAEHAWDGPLLALWLYAGLNALYLLSTVQKPEAKYGADNGDVARTDKAIQTARACAWLACIALIAAIFNGFGARWSQGICVSAAIFLTPFTLRFRTLSLYSELSRRRHGLTRAADRGWAYSLEDRIARHPRGHALSPYFRTVYIGVMIAAAYIAILVIIPYMTGNQSSAKPYLDFADAREFTLIVVAFSALFATGFDLRPLRAIRALPMSSNRAFLFYALKPIAANVAVAAIYLASIPFFGGAATTRIIAWITFSVGVGMTVEAFILSRYHERKELRIVALLPLVMLPFYPHALLSSLGLTTAGLIYGLGGAYLLWYSINRSSDAYRARVPSNSLRDAIRRRRD